MKDRTTPREVSELEIGWLAGIIDGEGSITFSTSKPTAKMRAKVIMGIHIVNTNKDILVRSLDIVKKIDPEAKNLKLKPKKYKRTNYKADPLLCHQITIRRQSSLKKVLELITPYLLEKQGKALKILNFINKHEFGKKISDEELEEYLTFTPVETKRVAL